MQTACYRCGATLEEGVPFCPQCGAPQIRVPGPEQPDETPATPPLRPGTPADIQPPAVPVATAQVNWQLGLRAAAVGGAIAAILSHLPVIQAGCCVWMLGAGALAVWFYRRRAGNVLLTTGAGAKLGALTGVLASVAFVIIGVIFAGTLRDELQRAMEQTAAANPDPRFAEMVARMSTPEGTALMLAIYLGFMAVLFLAFCAMGGAIAAAVNAPKEPTPPAD